MNIKYFPLFLTLALFTIASQYANSEDLSPPCWPEAGRPTCNNEFVVIGLSDSAAMPKDRFKTKIELDPERGYRVLSAFVKPHYVDSARLNVGTRMRIGRVILNGPETLGNNKQYADLVLTVANTAGDFQVSVEHTFTLEDANGNMLSESSVPIISYLQKLNLTSWVQVSLWQNQGVLRIDGDGYLYDLPNHQVHFTGQRNVDPSLHSSDLKYGLVTFDSPVGQLASHVRLDLGSMATYAE
jgi:hypothetical protein